MLRKWAHFWSDGEYKSAVRKIFQLPSPASSESQSERQAPPPRPPTVYAPSWSANRGHFAKPTRRIPKMCCTWFSFVNFLPVLSILVIVCWSYYAYVYELCLLLIANEAKRYCYIAAYHLVLIPFLVMYFLTMCHKQWYVPAEYYFPPDYYERVNRASSDDIEYALLVGFCKSRGLRVYTRNASGSIRVCHTCRLLKPDRTHHCSTCEACVVKMDHHCPWVNNCIGFTNYKYFMILVLYGGILCTYYFATTLEYTVLFFCHLGPDMQWRHLHIVSGTIIIGSLAIALWCLLGFHINLILHNETTLEAMHPPNFSSAVIFGFDRGRRENWDELCTMNCCCWIVPVDTIDGNGVDFEISRMV